MARTKRRAGAPLGRTSGSYRLGYTRRGLPRGLTLHQAKANLQIVNLEAEGEKEFRLQAAQEQFLISYEQRQSPHAIHQKPGAAEDARETNAEPALEP